MGTLYVLIERSLQHINQYILI